MLPPVIPGYTLQEPLGRGAFGSVWKATGKTGVCAVKVLEGGGWQLKHLKRSLEELKGAGPRKDLLPVLGHGLGGKVSYVCQALLPEGSVSFERLTALLPAHESWMLLEHLAGAMAWLHGRGVVHAGLSSWNVFVAAGADDEPQVLVGDVGQGWIEGPPPGRLQRQAAFIAPEYWVGGEARMERGGAYGRDVYAFGVVAWRLLNGGWPHGGGVYDQLLEGADEAVELSGADMVEWKRLAVPGEWVGVAANEGIEERRRIVERCLAADEGERYGSMEEVDGALRASLTVDGQVRVAAGVPEREAVVRKKRWGRGGKAEKGVEKVEKREEKSVEVKQEVKKEIETPVTTEVPVSGVVIAEAVTAGAVEDSGSGELVVRESAGGEGMGWWKAAVGRHGAWPAMTLLALAGSVSAVGYGLVQYAGRRSVEKELAAFRRSVPDVEAVVAQSRREVEEARQMARTADERGAAAGRAEVADLLGKLLASRPVDGVTMDAWRAAVRPVVVEAEKLFSGAAVAPTDRRSGLLLARMRAALGNEAEALPLLEKLARDIAQASSGAGEAEVKDLTPLKAEAEALSGSILLEQGRTAEALPHLQEASAAFDRWQVDAPEETALPPLYARNLLYEARALVGRDQKDEARTRLMRIPPLAGSDGKTDPESCFVVADAKYELAMLEGEAAKAIEGLNASLDLLIAYDRDVDSRSMACRSRMARGFLELGRLIARSENPMEATDAFRQSVELDTELMRENPDAAVFKLRLAETYNEVATLIHDAKRGAEGAREALAYQDYSISFLTKLRDAVPLDNGIRRALAGSLVLNGELQAAAGNAGTAMKRFEETVALVEKLTAEPSLTAGERLEVQRHAARALAMGGELREKEGKRREAMEDYGKAETMWGLAAPESEEDQVLAAKVKERVAKRGGKP
jgi:tetratricopeptide (TPR) repeat protein